ncbi:AAA family ATPase [Novosphingobium sp. TH158]|uniref:AAA family ATPase n=1 Tax=Novosphingobium sp. TH158 TaxID=2067455 RepID=UPI000C7CAF0D|nr:ATP-binding protein [Novosphingobium sp. TH158]PLK24508.1 N-acetylglucosamine-6-phosphate deacetylase [Novosphingobium sp. TH158]
MIRVCFHGAESTGKSVLAERLSREKGWPWVPEYGRTYCEEHGTDLSMADLLAIAEGQAEAVRQAEMAQPELLILDTDQLMTAAWAQMLFGQVPPSLLHWPKADLYLLFSPEVPWVDDGTRFFDEDQARQRFAGLAEKVLLDTGVPFVRIGGNWQEREAAARAAISALLVNS